jgi:hypothetical protein
MLFVRSFLARSKPGSKQNFRNAAGPFPFLHAATLLTIAKGPSLIFPADPPQGSRAMQTILLSCLFGAICTMVLWVVSAVATKRDQMMRRDARFSPPEEF